MGKQVNDNKELMSSEAAAEYLAITSRHLRDLVARRDIPYFKVGRLLRFDRRELDKWLDENKVEVA